MRTKNTSGFLRRFDRMASGSYVSNEEVGLDDKNKRILEKRIAEFAEKEKLELKRKQAQKQAVEIEEDESSEDESQQEVDEIADSDDGVDMADSDHDEGTEKRDDTVENQVEEAEEVVGNTNIVRVIQPDTYIAPPEDLEPPNQALIEAEEREEAEQAELRRRKGKGKAKEVKRTRELITDPDYQAENDMMEPSSAGASKKRKKGEEPEFTPAEYYKAFVNTGFQGTWYLDKLTIDNMGITTGVDDVLSSISMEKFAATAYPTYPKLASEFLSTLAVKDIPGDIGQEQFGGGMITFRAWGKSHVLYFNAIDSFFGFKEGKPVGQVVSKVDQHRVWNLIAGAPDDIATGDLPKQLKGGLIRNPAIHYTRRIIAETFFSRNETGTVSGSDLSMLTSSLSKLIETDEPIIGDVAGAGLTYLLCKHLEGFKSKVQTITRKKHVMAKMTIGGTITGILTLANVGFEKAKASEIQPRYMDGVYLRNHGVLTGPRDRTKFYYQFQTLTNTTAVVILPNRAITDLEKQGNYTFIPPQRLIIEANTLQSSPERALVPRDGPATQTKQKKKITTTPSGRGSAVRACVCTQAGYRERLIAEIEDSLQERVQKLVAESLAELTADFVRRSDLPRTSSQRSTRELPVHETAIARSTARPTPGSTSGSITQTIAQDTEEDALDHVPLKKRDTTLRLKFKNPAPKRA